MAHIRFWALAFIALSISATCSGFSLPCDMCEGVLKLIHEGGEHNSSEKFVVDAVEVICVLSGLSTHRICRAGVEEFYPSLRAVMRRTRLDSKAICSEILDKSCGSTFTSNWTVNIPPGRTAYVPPQLPKTGSPVVRVLHLADPHIDHHYAPGSAVDCGEPQCCRAWLGKGNAGKWGEPECDVPQALVENMLQHINRADKFDYTIWTGDIPPHDVWNQTKDGQISMIVSITKLIQQYLPDRPVYPAVGNHESVPVNVFAPESEKGEFSSQWLYNTLAETWKDWLPASALDTVRHGGFYSLLHSADLRIISMNFNFCGVLNFWLYVEDRDPYGQLEWLVGELEQAEKRGEKVHIIGHIPPGGFSCMRSWSKVYNLIIRRFQNTVKAQFYGHTHKDEMEVFFTEDDPKIAQPNSIAYIAPSVTTYTGHFPTYRIYDVDGGYANSSWTVLDHHNYMCNLTEANISNEPKWELEYSAREAYGMKSVFPRDWLEFARRLTLDDDLFSLYVKHYTHGPKPIPCDSKCRQKFICKILTSSYGDYSHCFI
ncbi:sphingomyelin phosphodiesterase-like [Sycon ciliatum]|uniref:sphingomyelin phosphodiesterase-like n=1 Tax=Sycon ciliatum TaxID=27933 RepID=UPI0031F707A4